MVFLREISLLQYYVAAHSFWFKSEMSLPSVWIIVYLNPKYLIESISSVYLYQIKYLCLVAYHIWWRYWNTWMLAMWRCKVALPSENIDDPLVVLRSAAAGSIFWFYSSPQSCCICWYGLIRELILQNQSETWIFSLHALLLWGSLIKVLWCNELFEDCPPHSSSLLLGEGSSRSKDQSGCLNLM